MRWLAGGVCVALLAVQLSWCVPVAKEDSPVLRSLPEQDALDALPISESNDKDTLRDKRTLGFIRRNYPGLARNPDENQLSGAESQVYESRVAPPSGFFDLQPAASNDDALAVAAPADDALAEGSEDGDEARNKRLTGFGGGSASGSGGGSGNFIFDIIRLFTGSSNTETTDDASQSTGAAEGTVEKDDGYQAGIPGPITRLFIIANRGIANLVQDLILRLAQTSERIVNFKARLITSII